MGVPIGKPDPIGRPEWSKKTLESYRPAAPGVKPNPKNPSTPRPLGLDIAEWGKLPYPGIALTFSKELIKSDLNEVESHLNG